MIQAKATLPPRAAKTSRIQSSTKTSSRSTWSSKTWWISCPTSSPATKRLRPRQGAVSISILHRIPNQVTTCSTGARAATSRLGLGAMSSQILTHGRTSLVRCSHEHSFSGLTFWGHRISCEWRTLHLHLRSPLARRYLWSSWAQLRTNLSQWWKMPWTKTKKQTHHWYSLLLLGLKCRNSYNPVISRARAILLSIHIRAIQPSIYPPSPILCLELSHMVSYLQCPSLIIHTQQLAMLIFPWRAMLFIKTSKIYSLTAQQVIFFNNLIEVIPKEY